MTATDELRKLLDERGVAWSDASDDDIQHTTWNNVSCWFSEFNDGWTGWGMSMGGTPEQAIAATLGRGTCRLEETEWVSINCPMYRCSECDGMFEDGRGDYRYCPNCGAKVVGE